MSKNMPGVWIGWNGGECPTHQRTLVDVATRNGVCEGVVASTIDWHSVTSSNRVLAFRIVREYREPREWWVHPERCFAADYDPQINGWVHVREVIDGEDAS